MQLPAAHDALTAKLIERAGFSAYQIGGFALAGARHGLPDIDLTRFAEQAAGVHDIINASSLPVLVDADDGYGDVKNVTYVVRAYEQIGVSAIFLEDQVAPKRCGHLSGKRVVPAEVMEEKIKSAAAARNSDLFLIARTDAREPEGLDAAIKRGERYLKAGADGLYIEAPKSEKELERIGKEFFGTAQMTNMFEGDNETPWLTPKELWMFIMIVTQSAPVLFCHYVTYTTVSDSFLGVRFHTDSLVFLTPSEKVRSLIAR